MSEFGSSGLNRSQFCRRQGLTLGVLNRCLKRLGAAQKLGADRADGCDLAVVLASGRRIFGVVFFDIPKFPTG